MKITKDSYFKFNGGEVHCKMEKLPLDIIMQDYTMDGFMALAEHVEIIRRKYPPYQLQVTYPYLPYARQDRVMQDNEPFSLHIFAKMLNLLKINKVTIWDPHSDVVPALIDNCHTVHQWEIAHRILPKELVENDDVLFISPDAGAYKKLSKLITKDGRIAIGVKNRDITGKITHTDIFSPVPIEGKDCIIVDDICDGGRTFIELAKVLKTKGANKVMLYVTHGIFSQGFLELDKYIDHIFTTNSFPHTSNERLTVAEVI